MKSGFGLLACAVAIVAACDRAPTAAAPLTASLSASTPLTSQPAQATPLVPAASLTPIVTSGDQPALGFTFAPIPDGLGAYQDGDNLVVYANHELTAGGVATDGGGAAFQYARVSRLVIDLSTLAVRDATEVLGAAGLYQRLCSATWVGAAEGFPSGYFLTGEESTGGAHDGIQLAIGKDGQIHELPWLGRYAHENLIGVPGFSGKVVLVGFDDTRGKSELYLYVAASEADVMSGNGGLYVFTSAGAPNSGALSEGQTISGRFVQVPNPAALSSGQLQTAVTGLGAFPFVRLEDGDYDRRRAGPGRQPATYFVDTGSETTLCNGAPCDAFGSIYRMEFDRDDPTQNAQLTLLQRSRGANVDWASPDNIAAGKNSLMVQEDPAYSGFARAPRIYNFRTNEAGAFVDRGQAVVAATNPECVEPLGTCWEPSGIIDASAWLGAGAWLFDVQAHTLPVPSAGLKNEGGQLLLLRLPGS